MGVSYFFPWITQRYPKILQKAEPETMPIIDHLYIDVNGVFHICLEQSLQLNEEFLLDKPIELIFQQIINYVNVLVNKVRPRKSVFIAIDGVVPAAKNYNQKTRRYQTAKRLQELSTFLQKNLFQKAKQFQTTSIAIVPGTEFMQTIDEQLEQLIVNKLDSDFQWSNLDVYYSNSSVPGEGEHKLFDFIRQQKQEEEFQKDTLCIYGNDSDLILLSLASHLKNVMILREQFQFQNEKMQFNTGHLNFEVVYINLIREYFELEYKDILKKNLNVDRFIDDFVLLAIFMGNDFVPQLYCMNVKQGIFDELMNKLKEFYEKKQEYLTDKFMVNWKNLSEFFDSIQYLQLKMIKSTLWEFDQKIEQLQKNHIYNDILVNEQKHENIEQKEKLQKMKKQKKEKLQKNQHFKNLIESDDDLNEDQQVNKVKETQQIGGQKIQPTMREKKLEHRHDDLLPTIKDNEYLQNFKKNHENLVKAKNNILLMKCIQGNSQEFKDKYYKTYFNDNINPQDVCEKYVQGIEFVLQYYHIGCQSWTWEYPFDSTPTMNDINLYLKKKSQNQSVYNFENSKPICSFEQLLLILPKWSFDLLPKSLKEFVLNEKSEILQYYPDSYDVIPSDNIRDYMWEIDCKRCTTQTVVDFFKKFDQNQLSEKEKKRNLLGRNLLFKKCEKSELKYDEQIQGLDKKTFKVSKTEFDIKEVDIEQYKNSEYTQIVQKQKVPSFMKVFKGLKLKEFPSKYSKYKSVFWLTLTKKSVKGYQEKLRKKEDNFNQKIIYHNSLFGKAVKNLKFNKISSKDLQLAQINDKTKQYFQNQYILFEDKNIFSSLNEIELFEYSPIYVQYVDFNNGKPCLKNMTDKNNNSCTFLEISLSNQYPVMKGVETSLKPSFYQNSLLLNVFNGNQYQSNTSYSFKTPKENIELVKQNNSTQKITLKNENNKILLTNKILKELGLEQNETIVLWLILDKIKIYISDKEHDSLFLNSNYHVGLNYLQIINQQFNNWRIDNENVKISRYQDQNALKYTCLNLKKLNKPCDFQVSVSQTCLNDIKTYFKELNLITDFLKNENSEENLIDENGMSEEEVQNKFSVEELYSMNVENKNQKFFQVFLKKLKIKSSINYMLSPNSLTLTKEQVKQISQQNQKDQKKHEISSVFEFIKFQQYKQILWTSFVQQPPMHQLGDRVVFVNQYHDHITFGEIGTVIGIYNKQIKILFDKKQIGATDLNGQCENYKGKLVNFWDVYNLSSWSSVLLKQKSNDSAWDGNFEFTLNEIQQIYKYNNFQNKFSNLMKIELIIMPTKKDFCSRKKKIRKKEEIIYYQKTSHKPQNFMRLKIIQ